MAHPGRRSFAHAIVLIGLLAAIPAHAWDTHSTLMTWVERGLSAELRQRLREEVPVTCPDQDLQTYAMLAKELELAPGSSVPSVISLAGVTEADCRAGKAIKPAFPISVILLHSVDEPDLRMDWMPEDYDPNHDRRYMGGVKGDTGKGFRHMFFGGWSLAHPITTFQVPFRSLGVAPERAVKFADRAKVFLKAGDRVWGARLISWSMHYVQDLSQPFHSVQVISPRMIPWSELWAWPPTAAFGRLVKQSNRTVANYHFALEHYVKQQLARGEQTPFAACLTAAEKHQNARFAPDATPAQIAEAVVKASIEIAPELGAAQLEFFGTGMMEPSVDVPNHVGAPDFAAMIDDPKLAPARERLNQVLCTALGNGVSASRRLIEWAMRP